MLEGIINRHGGKEDIALLLIQDSVEACGRGLLKAAIQATVKYDDIHVLLFEQTPEKFTAGLLPQIKSKLHIHDVTQDPLGWNTDGKDKTGLNLSCDFYQLLLSQKSTPEEAVVVIDNLTPLITYRSAPYTCNLLHKLKSSDVYKEVLCLLHGDLHEDHTVQMIQHCATCVLHTQPPSRPGPAFMCDIIYKKHTGKVTRKKEHFDLSSGYVVTSQEDVGLVSNAQQPVSSVNDPTANLTFNLSLSEKEQKDRSQVVLPYTIISQRNESNPGQGKIFYQPDEADDFDEEDPDDDLDI